MFSSDRLNPGGPSYGRTLLFSGSPLEIPEVFHLDLKRTEVAIDAGRLDEAWSILSASPLRQHRDGQALTDRLIAALVERGNQHFDEHRIDDAFSDAQLAARLAGRQVAVARLKARIKAAETKTSKPTTAQSPNGAVVNGSPIDSKQRNDATPIRNAILHVDGLGGLLLVRSDFVSIGTTASRGKYDVTLQTTGHPSSMRIVRQEDDYFLRSSQTLIVNGREMSEHLLSDGDRISVGKRGRLRFRRPVLASGSAVLEITGARLPRRSIRKVLLMDDSLLFGGNGCHLAAAVGDTPVIMRPSTDGMTADLVEASGQGRVPTRGEYWIHHQGSFDPQRLDMGSTIRFGDCNFTLSQETTSDSPFLPSIV